MKRVQLAGGTFDVESYLVGLERELRVDTSNDSLRLHDGVKIGGFEILNRDQNNVLYQAASPELDGFDFGAQEKGIITRVGPATYRVRRIEVDEDNMVITNPRGTLGNFLLELAPTILSNHQVDGLWIFTQPIEAEGGVVGDLVGNVTGDLTGDSFGTHTGDTIGLHTGSVVIPDGDTITGDDDSIAENMIHTLLINRGVPYGAILMWSGIIAEIPESWALCDGTNGTPDLRDRFIVGAGGAYSELETGGSTTASGSASVLSGGAHEHDITVADHTLTILEIPSHFHHSGVCDGNPDHFNHGTVAADPPSPDDFGGGSGSGTTEGLTAAIGGGDSHTHAGSTADLGGEHTHDITLDEITVLPPYYALCFIMKIAPDV